MRNFLLAIILIGILPACSLFQSHTKLYEESIVDQPFDVIIVPGYPYNSQEDSTWNQVHKIRIVWANYLYKQGIAKNIIFSGDAVYTPYFESEVMKLYAEQLNISTNHIYTEKRAEHSVENVYYSYRIAKEKGFKKIALATDPYQTKSVRKFIKRYDLDIELLPIMFDSIHTDLKDDITLQNPQEAKVTDSDFVPLDEKESLIKRFRGTMGRNIVWHKEDLKSKSRIRKFRRQGRLVE